MTLGTNQVQINKIFIAGDSKMSMREFKVIRMNTTRTKLYEDFVMFEDLETADTWADNLNKEVAGTVVDVEEMPNQDELKYEY